MNVLVTGGAGFVGSNLAIGLRDLRPDIAVTALDNLKRRGSELNVPRLNDAGVRFIHGDVRAPEDLDVAGGVDVIIECSAEPSVLAGYNESPRYLLDTNLLGTINCLELARHRKAAMIFLSTSRVYPVAALNDLAYHEAATRFVLNDRQPARGVGAGGISEDFTIEGARSLYGATKLCSEFILQEYLETYGMRGVINRCGIIAGPWQMGRVDQGVAALWAARHIYGGDLSYIGYGGTGKQVRDMLHIQDLLDLVLHEIDHINELNGRVFNVGGGVEVSASLQELTVLCEEITGNTIAVAGNPQTRVADIPIYITDCSRIHAATGWKPRRNLRTIITDIIKWIQNNKESLRPILS